MNRPQAIDPRALLRVLYSNSTALSIIPIVTGPVNDNAKVGSFVACVARTTNATANTDTSFSHALGRVPNGYWVWRNANGGIVYDGSNPAAWSTTTITLRCTTASDVVSFFVF